MTIWVFAWRILVRPIVPPDWMVKTNVAKKDSGTWLKRWPCKLINRGNHHRRSVPVDLIIYCECRDWYSVRNIWCTSKGGVNSDVVVSIRQLRFFRKKGERSEC